MVSGGIDGSLVCSRVRVAQLLLVRFRQDYCECRLQLGLGLLMPISTPLTMCAACCARLSLSASRCVFAVTPVYFRVRVEIQN